MSLPRFLDCATTMLYEEFQRVGQSVFEAFDTVRTWVAGGEPTEAASAPPPPPPAERVPSAAENDRSMQAFMGMLSGVKGAPG